LKPQTNEEHPPWTSLTSLSTYSPRAMAVDVRLTTSSSPSTSSGSSHDIRHTIHQSHASRARTTLIAIHDARSLLNFNLPQVVFVFVWDLDFDLFFIILWSPIFNLHNSTMTIRRWQSSSTGRLKTLVESLFSFNCEFFSLNYILNWTPRLLYAGFGPFFVSHQNDREPIPGRMVVSTLILISILTFARLGLKSNRAPTSAQSEPIASFVVSNQAETTPGAHSWSNGCLRVELYSLLTTIGISSRPGRSPTLHDKTTRRQDKTTISQLCSTKPHRQIEYNIGPYGLPSPSTIKSQAPGPSCLKQVQ
jgi:hypothetical protein